MLVDLTLDQKTYKVNLKEGLDISLGIGTPGPRAWYVPNPEIQPVVGDNFIGSVAEGSSVNFFTIQFNPHGHGTHTECLGHITKEHEKLDDCLKSYFFTAQLISVTPQLITDGEFTGDLVITANLLNEQAGNFTHEALIIRTLPNSASKKNIDYSNTNPPYLSNDAAHWLVEKGVQHLLIDLPSVDRENDEGKLSVHHLFWGVPNNIQAHKTITELIYVPTEAHDGLYLLNLQVASFANDAAPSRPIVYALL